MARTILTALASLACGLALAGATTPPPSDSSHVPKQPPAATPKPAAEKPKPKAAPASAKPAMSAWRRAYVARTGHEPGAPAKAAHAAPAKKIAPSLPKKKRCT